MKIRSVTLEDLERENLIRFDDVNNIIDFQDSFLNFDGIFEHDMAFYKSRSCEIELEKIRKIKFNKYKQIYSLDLARLDALEEIDFGEVELIDGYLLLPHDKVKITTDKTITIKNGLFLEAKYTLVDMQEANSEVQIDKNLNLAKVLSDYIKKYPNVKNLAISKKA